MSNKKSIKDLEFKELEELVKKRKENLDCGRVFSVEDIWLVYENTRDQVLSFAIQELIMLKDKEKKLISPSFDLSSFIKISNEIVNIRTYIDLLIEEIAENNTDIKELLELNNSI